MPLAPRWQPAHRLLRSSGNRSFPRGRAHPWLFNNKEYLNNVQATRRYAAEVSGVDDGVGRVLETLKKHRLDENTLVVFTADQGWGGGQHGI